jgi:hypothetical protein
MSTIIGIGFLLIVLGMVSKTKFPGIKKIKVPAWKMFSGRSNWGIAFFDAHPNVKKISAALIKLFYLAVAYSLQISYKTLVFALKSGIYFFKKGQTKP